MPAEIMTRMVITWWGECEDCDRAMEEAPKSDGIAMYGLILSELEREQASRDDALAAVRAHNEKYHAVPAASPEGGEGR